MQLLRQCEIDPTVLPVWLEKGGESAALHRWNLFKKGLGGYARRRNNAADSSGVSRLSPSFLRLSPVMKVAMKKAEIGTKSAEKFLDELLVFREHAWHHVYATDEPYHAQNLPSWARILGNKPQMIKDASVEQLPIGTRNERKFTMEPMPEFITKSW